LCINLPKAKWGSGDQALTASDIDNAKSNEFTTYAGPIPPSGLYRFVTKSMLQTVSSKDNPMLRTILELDGTWKPKHKQFDGCPLFDYMPVMKSTAFRSKAFCEAYGISPKEFLTGILVDEDGKVTKLASAGDPAGIEVYINVKYVPAAAGYNEKIALNGTGYLPVDDAPEDDGDAPESDEADSRPSDDDEEPPF
jgi:hypothetical protein